MATGSTKKKAAQQPAAVSDMAAERVARAKRRPVPLVAGLDFQTGKGNEKLPSQALHRWIAMGINNNQQLADLCLAEQGVETTRAGISYWRKVHGYPPMRTRNASTEALVPWRIKSEHSHDRRIRFLRAEARIREGLPVNEPDLARHHAVMNELRKLKAVVYYDQENGFQFVPPRPGIDTDLISDPRIRDDGTHNGDKTTYQ